MSSPLCKSKPMIIAHRGGGQNWPENTIFAFKRAMAAGVDAIELDVQLTADQQLAVYHPRDLSERTEGAGPIKSKTLEQIQSLEPGICSATNSPSAPDPELRIPALPEVLRGIPGLPLIIDLKSLPAEPLIRALAKQIPQHEFSRLIFYSTEQEHIELLRQILPAATVFEDRNTTFERLIKIQSPDHWASASGNSSNLEISEKTSLGVLSFNLDLGSSGLCTHPSASSWIGFELKRKLKIEEPICTSKPVAEVETEIWNQESIDCTRTMAHGAHVVFFGINTREDYEAAILLGADAVYTDSPATLIKLSLAYSL